MGKLIRNRWTPDSYEYKKIEQTAISHGAQDFGISSRKGKKYVVTYNNRKIHYGSTEYQDFTIHQDEARRDRYRSRHKGITLKNGEPAYMNKKQPAYWSYWTIW